MALGFAFFVVDNAALAMGGFGGYPPLLAAWAPFVLFFLVGETVLIVSGSSARMASGMKDCPVDAAIVGIIDAIEVTD